MKAKPEVVIITGVSGSGKTTFLKALEDIGFYCMDNLPIEFIPKLMEHLSKRKPTQGKFALVVDIREENFRENFSWLIKALRKDYRLEVIFLDAENQEIIRRFKLLRRIHPLQEGTSLEGALSKERKILDVARRISSELIDTTGLSMGELRRVAIERYRGSSGKQRIKLVSFGFVYGIPRETDFLFDLRFLPNPYWVEELRELDGTDERIRDFLLSHEEVLSYLESIKKFISENLHLFFLDGRGEITISLGCTGGRHRSVFFISQLYNWLEKLRQYDVIKIHRDMRKG